MKKMINAVKAFFLGKGRVALQEKALKGDLVLTLEVDREAKAPLEEIMRLLGADSLVNLASFLEVDLLDTSVCIETQEAILGASTVIRVKRGSMVRVYAKRP